MEGLAHKAHGGANMDAPSIAGSDAHALLAPVLQRVEAEENDARHIIAARVNADNTARLVGVIALRDVR
jgi:hypothetical protein